MINTVYAEIVKMEELKDFVKSREKVNLCMVLLNILVFVVLEFLGNTEDPGFMLGHGASFVPLIVERGEYYRLFTSMFLHFGIEHLFNNMLVLIFLGDMLEKLVGKWRYLLIYLLGGLGGNLLSLAMELRSGEFAVSAGASGAIFAVIGALVFLVVWHRGRIPGVSGRRLLLMAALSLFQGFFSTGVDAMAHLGGFLSGFVLALVLIGRRRLKQVPAGFEDRMI